MGKIAVIYWSGTGNTEEMAKAALAGAKKGGADAALFEVEQFNEADMGSYDGFLFGCPAMGDEVLEESCFEPFFAAVEDRLKDVPVGLFGSYGWGGGAWMHIWESRVKDDGAKLYGDGVMAENAPDAEALAQCEALGEGLAKSL